jgi:hypothetical protein
MNLISLKSLHRGKQLYRHLAVAPLPSSPDPSVFIRVHPWPILFFFSFFALSLALGGCGDDDSGQGRDSIALAAEGNRLHAYTTTGMLERQTVIPSASDDPATGRDVNGQICFHPGTARFVTGEDTGQPDPPPGFGFFELSGHRVGELSFEQIGKLTPTFQGEPGEEGVPNSADPYGCGFLSDGRLVTSDIGNNASGPGNGQLIIWFPPFDGSNPEFCKLDIAVATAQGIFVDERDNVHVASARGDGNTMAGTYRYRPPFPTSADAEGGCGSTDSTGAPLADTISKELFIPADPNAPTPNGVVGTPEGTFYVSSVITGTIAEYDADGVFKRLILEPPPDESLGPEPYSTGTPLGIALDSDGTVYLADLGLVVDGSSIGPGPRTGSVKRIRFDGGEPAAPETLQSSLSFPDAVGIYKQD